MASLDREPACAYHLVTGKHPAASPSSGLDFEPGDCSPQVRTALGLQNSTLRPLGRATTLYRLRGRILELLDTQVEAKAALPPFYTWPLSVWFSLLISPLPPVLSKSLQTAGPLPSTGVTRLPRYYQPSATLSPVSRLPGAPGYTAYPAPPISRRGEEGLSSCLALKEAAAILLRSNQCPKAQNEPSGAQSCASF